MPLQPLFLFHCCPVVPFVASVHRLLLLQALGAAMSAADGTPPIVPPAFKRTTSKVAGGLVPSRWQPPLFSVFRRSAISYAAPWLAVLVLES